MERRRGWCLSKKSIYPISFPWLARPQQAAVSALSLKWKCMGIIRKEKKASSQPCHDLVTILYTAKNHPPARVLLITRSSLIKSWKKPQDVFSIETYCTWALESPVPIPHTRWNIPRCHLLHQSFNWVCVCHLQNKMHLLFVSRTACCVCSLNINKAALIPRSYQSAAHLIMCIIKGNSGSLFKWCSDS